jgi:uncharacterized protein (TIGR02145 family)
MVTYRDGTPIPQVTDNTEWENLTTGAWSYYNNDPTKPRLYNWYAVMGIYDTDPNTPNKEFAPEGWHVPSDAEWTTLENYLIANGYDASTTPGIDIGFAMASTTGWNNSYPALSLNNRSALMPSLRVTVTSMVRSTMRVALQSFGVPLRTMQIPHGTAI